MNTPLMGNGAGTGSAPEESPWEALEGSARVLDWLEQSFGWLLRAGDTLSAGAILGVLGMVSNDRQTLMERLLTDAEQASAMAMVEGS